MTLMTDDSQPPRDNRTAPLLSELEALKDSLDHPSDIDPQAIPVLDDIIEPSPHLQPPETVQRQRPGSEETGHEREVFIQSLIDDMMPELEAALRRRLLELDKPELERLYRQSQQED